jgi:cytochrome c553
MIIIQKNLALVFATAFGLFANTAFAADASKGAAALKKNQCASCHGDNYTKSTDNSIPKLAGQHQDYLVQALRQYKLGDNKAAPLSRNNAIMTSQAKKLSDADIDNIAAYLSSLKGDLVVHK